jgi:hypothetical protein
MLGRQDLEADGLLKVSPGLERDLLEPGAVVAARPRPAFFISAATYSAAAVFRVPDFLPLKSLEARKAMWAKAFAPSAVGRTAARSAAPTPGTPADGDRAR